MKPVTLMTATLALLLSACRTSSRAASATSPVPESGTALPLSATSAPSLSPTFLTPSSTPQIARTRLFYDDFAGTTLDAKWIVLEGDAKLEYGNLEIGNGQTLVMRVDVDLPSQFTVQFDINQCGNYGALTLTVGNQMQFEFLSDLSTIQREYRDGRWIDLPPGRIHRCAAHIVLMARAGSYAILNVHNNEVVKILEGEIAEALRGPITVKMTPYASIGSFLITSP